MKRIYQFILLSKKFYKSLLLGLGMFTLVKLIFIIRFGSFSTFNQFYTDIPQLIVNSLRFDLQTLTYILSIVFLINLFVFFSKSKKLLQFVNKFSITLIPILLIISLMLLIADQQFYSFFKLHFNTVAFDFLNEEPKLLIKSIWLEHPVIKIFLLVILSFFVIKYFIKRIYSKTQMKKNEIGIIPGITISVILVSFYLLLMRGSLGTFPLQNEDTNVSENEFVNACVPNGLFMLKEAYSEAKKEIKLQSPDQELRKFGYTSIQEAYADLKGIPVDSVHSDNIEQLIFKTSKGVQQEKYNVVLFIMESMSNHFIEFHDEKVNLLGSFEEHFNQDIVFRNFQSSGNGTIVSLENLILNAPFHRLFETRYRFKSYDISIAKPFKDAGYKTNFITGIELGWRHLDETLSRQYFDHVYGKNHILRNYPEAMANDTWGIFDHHVFDYIFKVLEESDSAQFIANLSSTNHTPYELPENYKPYPIDKKIAKNPAFSVPKERCLEVLTAFQYSNDALGRFMNKIKNSKLAENTIVIITGDHNIRSTISYNSPELQKFKYSVPLYLYIPKKLKNELYIDTSRIASHYDIMSSIYPYILKDIPYPDLGQDLFSNHKSSDEYYSINDEQLLFGSGLSKEQVETKKRARLALLYYYYSTVNQESKK